MDPYPRKSACICGLFFFSLRSLCLLRLLSPGLDLCAFVTLCEPGHELYLSRNVVFCYLGRDFGVRFSQCSFSRTCSGRRVHSVSGENDVHRFIPIDRARCFDGARSLAVTRGEVKRYVHDAASQRRNLTPLAVFVREEFSDAIRGKGFSPEDNSTTDNRFRLAVRKYGFGMAELVSREVRPLMTLYAELVTPDNKVLWSHEAVIRSDDKNLPAILPEQLRSDPDEQEMLLRAAAHRASEKLMENYQGKAKKADEIEASKNAN